MSNINWKNVFTTSASFISIILLIKELRSLYNKANKLTSLPPRSRGVESLIGNTPLIEIKSLSKLTGCKIYAKLELMNPGGSAKDRVAYEIIKQSESKGLIKPNENNIIFEGTSGSTGISFAILSNALGYIAHICLPDDTSHEKLQLLTSLGVEIEKVKPASIVDPNQYVNVARSGAEKINNSNTNQKAIFANQFENDFNWRIHYKTTGPEIYKQMEEKIDVFINGSGTGGTITGVGKYLKEKIPGVKIILADPQGSGLANRINYGVMYDTKEKEGTRRRHQVDTLVEGIGLNRLTWNFKQGEQYIDEAIRVTDEQALKMAKFLCKNDGLFWGSSASINCVAAVKTAFKYGPGQKIVVIACDSGERHLSKFWNHAKEYENVTLDEVLK
ncbi:unnamed protein product [Candida verbasci]|uniref:Tryptophan synthase beta chain-like PALP domain-containing protein n=1 Tax=Candida verbasci TaxID=1227364 RepID=A0A9W4XFR8_9ASCO|nr:unnamed protein product [Candida verbasci]